MHRPSGVKRQGEVRSVGAPGEPAAQTGLGRTAVPASRHQCSAARMQGPKAKRVAWEHLVCPPARAARPRAGRVHPADSMSSSMCVTVSVEATPATKRTPRLPDSRAPPMRCMDHVAGEVPVRSLAACHSTCVRPGVPCGTPSAPGSGCRHRARVRDAGTSKVPQPVTKASMRTATIRPPALPVSCLGRTCP